MIGEIFDIKRFAVHDGPGIRCTAFLKGCPLDCMWCHNPEGKQPGMEICCRTPHVCIRCRACLSTCNSNAVKLGSNGIIIDRKQCVRCGACAMICPTSVLSAKGYMISSEDLVAEFMKEQVFFQTSGGGVTLSGGDPLFQPLFTKEILERAKANNLHTAVQTCLYAAEGVLESLVECVDLWLCDIKIMDDETHRRLTGKSNKQILSNYEFLIQHGFKVSTRVPVIPDCTDSEENLTAIGQYVNSVNPEKKLELIFYNLLGQAKYNIYGLEYELTESVPYTAVQQNDIRMMIAKTGVSVQ